MMTYKSTQGNSRKHNKNNEKYEQAQDTSQDAQDDKKKHKKKKTPMKYIVPPRFETPSSSNVGVVRSQTHHDVARTTTATSTIATASTSVTASTSAANVPLVPVMPPMVAVPVPSYYRYGNPPVNYVNPYDWHRLMTEIHVNNPTFNMARYGLAVPVYSPPSVLHAPMYMHPGQMIRAPMMPSPYMRYMIPPPPGFRVEAMPSISYYASESVTNTSVEQIVPTLDVTSDSSAPAEANLSSDALMFDSSMEETPDPPDTEDPLESYLLLSRKSFPPANMMSLDPNPMIDELCSLANLHNHVPWLLDLEFGLPKGPITRPIPIYNVAYNSIHCKNTPNAIHPGFESCSDSFKRAIRLYYDCVISVRYNAFMKLYRTRSVESFQEWLILGMQAYGMCWP